MSLKKSKVIGVVLLLAMAVAIGTPANGAGGSMIVTCAKASDVCTVSVTPSGKAVTMTTSFTSVKGGNAAYRLRKGPYGAAICSGTIGYNHSKTCNIGSYRGQVSFVFFKGHSVSGSMKISG